MCLEMILSTFHHKKRGEVYHVWQVYAYNNKYHDKNYSPFTKLLKLPTKTRDYIVSDFEIETFMSNIYEPYLTACQLALWHGLRRGEVCHLELTDIDFSNNIIKVQKKPHLNWNPKNETSIRTIPIYSILSFRRILRFV